MPPDIHGRRHLAILSFHKIGPPPSGYQRTQYYIPEKVFLAKLRHLTAHGWEMIDLERCLRGLADPDSLPLRAVLLTFDDGYCSLRRRTLPLLRRMGVPGVVFMPTDFIGGRNTFDTGVEPPEELCGWSDLRALHDAGIAVQAHGAAHRSYARLTLAEQAADLRRSKAVLEAELGRPVKMMAYPYGDMGSDQAGLKAVLKETGYQAACLFGGGANVLPGSDPYRLTRLAMEPIEEMIEYKRHLAML